MEALVFAAGLGTRLRPLTNRMPKALVDVEGTPMLERVARRLAEAGVGRLVVNVHVPTFADRIELFVRERAGFGMDVAFSREEGTPLETGGGLSKARALLVEDGPLFLHNADVLTDLPLATLAEAHDKDGALATLAVMARPSSRYLLFDDLGLLGRVDETKELEYHVRKPVGTVQKLGFSGVHVVSREFLERITERGAFSILDPYLRLAGEGARIHPFRVDGCQWIDIGRPEQLEAARLLVREGRLG